MTYPAPLLDDVSVPKAQSPLFQHLIDTYASEINKVATVWSCFSDADLAFRVHPRSTPAGEIMKHELLSGRRFFGEFLGSPEPPPGDVVPEGPTVDGYRRRLGELARPRLDFLASRTQDWWLLRVPFFDVVRERIWIFWRRVLHTAHHRTQLSVYLRALGKPVPPTYGPTVDASWTGADPTTSADAAGRKGPAAS